MTKATDAGFVIGRYYEVVNPTNSAFAKGDIYRFKEDDGSDMPLFEFVSGKNAATNKPNHPIKLFRLVLAEKQPHRWVDEIVAWARGEIIQCRYINTEYINSEYTDWVDTHRPIWYDVRYEFRVKPKPKPDVIRYGIASVLESSAKVECLGDVNLNPNNNIKLIFDGDTLKLKSVEVINTPKDENQTT